MKNLYEIAKICSRHNKVLDSLIPQNEQSPLRQLFSIVSSDLILDDNECMMEIYGKRNLVAFSRLKSRLKEILFQSILLQNNSNDPEYARFDEVVNANRATVVARILNNKKAFSISNELIEKSIAKSIKYHLTENVLAQARILVVYNSNISLNKYKINKYTEIQQKYLRIYEWEIKSENYFLDLQRNQLQSLANVGNELKLKAQTYYSELQKARDIRSFNFNYNKYRILAALYEYQKDYYSLLQLSEEAYKEFSAPDFKSEAILSNINLRRLWSFIQAGKFKEAYSFGSRLMEKSIPGSNAWYRAAYYTLKARLYNGEYLKAANLIFEMFNNPKFQKLSEYYSELFNTTLGYMHLVAESELAGDSKKIKERLPEFKIGRFLNTTPVFSKDKRGINVSILLMHIAFLLQKKNYDAIIDRIDSLNQYAYRYLRKDDSFRSNCMIKMVIQMTKADFNPIRTERYTADLKSQLSQTKLAGSGENIEIEVIPFEILWDIMVKSL